MAKTWRDEKTDVVHSAFYNDHSPGTYYDQRWTTGCWIVIDTLTEVYHVHRRPITCMTCVRWAS